MSAPSIRAIIAAISTVIAIPISITFFGSTPVACENVGPRSAARVQAVVAAPAMGQDWISDLRRTRIRELQLVKRF